MRIRFQPQDTKHPADKIVITNLGEFKPGQERLLTPDEEAEGKRLVSNGDFVNPDEEVASVESPIAEAEEAVSSPKKSPKK